MAICMVWWDLKWKETDFWVQRDCPLQRCRDPWTAGYVGHWAHMLLILHVSGHLNTSAKVITHQESSQARGWTHTQMLEDLEEHRRAGERKEESFPHCYRPLRLLRAHTQSTESTFHLPFKQIAGLAGHYHLECPVMGNWGGKGAAYFWLIFTKVFVCFSSNVNDAADRVEQKGHCGLNYGIVPIKFCLLSAWLMMNTIL